MNESQFFEECSSIGNGFLPLLFRRDDVDLELNSSDECSLIATDLRNAFIDQDQYEPSSHKKKRKFLSLIKKKNDAPRLQIVDHYT